MTGEASGAAAAGGGSSFTFAGGVGGAGDSLDPRNIDFVASQKALSDYSNIVLKAFTQTRERISEIQVAITDATPNVRRLGGDIKDVSDGYARNFLIPQRIATRADESSTKIAIHQKKMIELKKEKRKKSMQDISGSLKGKEVEVLVKVGENDKLFGSVTPQDISNALKKIGFEVDKRKIEITETIKALGTFQAKIKLADGIISVIQVKVTKQD